MDGPSVLTSGKISTERLHSRTLLSSWQLLSSRAQPVQFTLHHRTRRYLWVLIQVLLLLNAVQLTALAAAYIGYAIAPDSSLLGYLSECFLTSSEQADLSSLGFSIGVAYAMTAAVFAYSSGSMIIYSIQQRAFSFGPKASVGTATVAPVARTDTPIAWRHRVKAVVRGVRIACLSLWISIGVRGEYFEVGMLLRESLEILLQTVQAYNTSNTISNRIVNLGYGVLMLLNVTLGPLLGRVFAHGEPHLNRLIIVFTDFILDFTWGLVLPLIMFTPYVGIDSTKACESLLLAKGFGFIEKAQREVQQIVVLSFRAFLLSIFPYVGALVSLHSVQKLLRAARYVTTNSVVPTTTGQTVSPESATTASLLPPATSRVDDTRHTNLRIVHFARTVLMVYGIGVFIVILLASGLFVQRKTSSLSSSLVVNSADCLFPLYPWFTTEHACTSWFIRCNSLNITGVASELTAAIELIDTNSLALLAFSDCPAIEIPVAMHNLTALLAIIFFNSHISQWPANVPISQAQFPQLQTFVVDNTSIATDTLALGGMITGNPWVTNLERVFFVASDISLFARYMTTEWSTVKKFHCIACGFTEFPHTLFSASTLHQLKVAATAIPSIDSDKQQSRQLWPALETIEFDSNWALTTLDDSVWRRISSTNAPLTVISIAQTNISTVPDFVIDSLANDGLKITATGAPVCRNASLSVEVLAALSCS